MQSNSHKMVANIPQTKPNLSVNDAMEYVELVKTTFLDRHQVYSDFLDTMKDYKSKK